MDASYLALNFIVVLGPERFTQSVTGRTRERQRERGERERGERERDRERREREEKREREKREREERDATNIHYDTINTRHPLATKSLSPT
jgi:hypothetical protein